MSAEDIARYQKEAVIGHRTTWKMGMNGGRPTSRSHSSRLHPEFSGADDPLGIFREFGGPADARRASERRFLGGRPPPAIPGLAARGAPPPAGRPGPPGKNPLHAPAAAAPSLPPRPPA